MIRLVSGRSFDWSWLVMGFLVQCLEVLNSLHPKVKVSTGVTTDAALVLCLR